MSLEVRKQLRAYIGTIITWHGDVYRVINVGNYDTDEDTVYLHLASTTRFRVQKNGKCPNQICDAVPVSVLQGVK